MISFTIPMRLWCGPNVRLHWATKAKRVAEERRTVAAYAPLPWKWRQLRAEGETFRVTLVRIAPRNVDSDNLQGLLKHTRDEVARLLGIDDGSELVTWDYAQEKSKPKEYAVRVTVEAREVET